VEGFGAAFVMTRADHPSGTDRVAEVARGRDWAQVIVNIQGDEPLLPASYIDAGIAAFAQPAVRMATLVTPVRDASELGDPGVAKVVADRAGNALYFSRAPIPFVRGEATTRLRHVGIYFFERAALFEFVGWPPSPLERAEGLEQLRALENGLAVRLVHVPEATHHVDTIEDLERVERIVSQHQGR
jgi:3-deoxy-manno-octulosonate cytidylyltransferase (CMP-KDO synthetase)